LVNHYAKYVNKKRKFLNKKEDADIYKIAAQEKEMFIINKCFLIGNLTKNPDERVMPNGITVTTFTVAVNRKFKDETGNTQTDFIPAVAWRGLAENCSKYLHKGSKVAVFGAIQIRSYEAQDGSKRYVTEIVADEVQFLDSKPNMKETEQALKDIGFEEDEPELPF